MSSDIQAAYDEVYHEGSAERVDLDLQRWPKRRHAAVAYLAPGGGGRVLDVGCGSGKVLYNLRHKYDELHGLELSEQRVATARKMLEGLDATISSGNIETGLDYPDGHFDAIVTSDVIEHVVNVWAAMSEMKRLLKPGGHVVLTTPNIAFWLYRLRLLGGVFPSTSARNEGFATRTPNEPLDGGHLHYFTYSMLRKLFDRYEFSRVESFGIGRLGKIHDWWPELLSGACVVVATR